MCVCTRRTSYHTNNTFEEKFTYTSIIAFKNGAFFLSPSILARDWTNVIGIMKKNVRKKKATPIMSFLIVSETYGIARFSQYTSRGSGAHSVSHKVGFLDCCVCAQTAAAHRVLKETNATGMIAFASFLTLSRSSSIYIQN